MRAPDAARRPAGRGTQMLFIISTVCRMAIVGWPAYRLNPRCPKIDQTEDIEVQNRTPGTEEADLPDHYEIEFVAVFTARAASVAHQYMEIKRYGNRAR